MKGIDWARKLTSRKFWAAVARFVTPTMVAAGLDDSTVTQVTAIIMGGTILIVYIIDEGTTDAAAAGTGTTNKDEVTPK